MGRLACEWIVDAPDLELVARLGRRDAIDEYADRCDVAVDLTRPDAAESVVEACVRKGIAVVSGTSGWTASRIETLQGSTRNAPNRRVLIVPNFSVGAVLLARFAREAAPFFASSEIVETHHQAKVDAPSGAATWLAGEIRAGLGHDNATVDEESGPRGQAAAGVLIHSLRMAGALAEHEVRLGRASESLKLVHTSTDRHSFAAGLLTAVRAVCSLEGVHVGLEPFLDQLRPR